MMELARTSFAAAAVSHLQMEEGVPAALPLLRGTASKPTAKRVAALRWVMPVGALAAGILVWVAVRETRQNQVMKSSQVEVAENRPATANAPTSPAPAPKPVLPESQSAEARMRALEESLNQSSTALVRKPASSLESKPSSSAAVPVLTRPMLEKGKEKPESQASNDLAESRIAPAPSAPPGVNSYAAQNRELPSTQNAQPAALARRAATDQVANTGRPREQQNQTAKIQTQTAETAEVTAEGGAVSQSVRDVLPEGGTIIVAPNDAYSWRVGSGGKIEHSTDNSRTWMLQKSGVTADLTAGSASSGKICWVVGKAGTVLLTTDRGKHWKQLASPTKEDLAGVNAVDDKSASIWTASHTKSFETSDGGVTWSPIGIK